LFQLQVSLDALYFLPQQAAFTADLATLVGVSPAQLFVLNTTDFGDATVLWLQLLPLSASQVLNATAIIANCMGTNVSNAPLCAGGTLPPQFGALTLLSSPPIPGPPRTYIVDSTRPQGRVFPRFLAQDPGLTVQGWIRPSPKAEAPGVDPFAFIAFYATLGWTPGVTGSEVPCTSCTFACRLDFGPWVQNCISPFPANGLTPGEHFFQVVATAPDGTSDSQAAFHAWAIAVVPWVRYQGTPGGATNSNAVFNLTAAPDCVVVQYSLDSVTWTPVSGFVPSNSSGNAGSDGMGGEGSTSAVSFALNTTGISDGLVTLAVQCVTTASGVSVPASYAFILDTYAPVTTVTPGNYTAGASTHSLALSWTVSVNDANPTGGISSGIVLIEYRLVVASTNTTVTGFPDWSACSAPACAGNIIAVNGLLALPSGTYALQARARDAAGNVGAPGEAQFVVDVSVPVTPRIALSVSTIAGQATPAGALVVTPGDNATAWYYITNVTNGIVSLNSGSSIQPASAGTFVSLADGTSGLIFTPSVTGALFGFYIQAADSSKSVSRLSMPPVWVNITIQSVNVPPVLNANFLFTMKDVFITGMGARTSMQGTTVSAILKGGVIDANPNAVIGMAVLRAVSSLGTWEASVTGGINWFSLAGTSLAQPIVLAPSAKLRFTTDLTAPLVGASMLSDWAGSASLAFLAWDGTDGGVSGTSNATVYANSTAAAAAAALNATLAAVIAGAPNGTTVSVPLNVTYAIPGSYSANVGALVLTLRGAQAAALARNTPDQTYAARLAAEAAAQLERGCYPPQPGAVELLPDRLGMARMVSNATGAPLADVSNTSWTVEAWVLKRARLSSTTLLASANTSSLTSGNGALLLEAGPATWQLGVRLPGASPSGANDIALGAEAPLGMWTHVAFVYDNTTSTLTALLNGVAIGSQATLGAMPLPQGWVGSPIGPSAFAIDNLRIWTVARTAAQIAASSNSLLPAPSPGANAAMLWPDITGLSSSFAFQEQCNTTAYNAGPTQATLQLLGGSIWVVGVQLACATVDGSFPVAGPVAGGGEITLLGSGFLVSPPGNAPLTANCVFLDSAGGHPTYARALAVSNTSVTCVTPPSGTGPNLAQIAYVDAAEGCIALPQDSVTYEYSSTAHIEGLVPTSGPAVGGTLISVSGANLLPATWMPLCRFTLWRTYTGDGNASRAMVAAITHPGQSWSSTQLLCVSPPLIGEPDTRTASVLVDISLNGGASWIASPMALAFTYSMPMPLPVFPPLQNSSQLHTSTLNKTHNIQLPIRWPSGPTNGGSLLTFDMPPMDGSSDEPETFYNPVACGFGTIRPVASRMLGPSAAACISPARGPARRLRPLPLSVSDNGRDWMFAQPPRKAVIAPEVALPRKFVTHTYPVVDSLWPEIISAAGGTPLTVFGSNGSAAVDLACVFGVSLAAAAAQAHSRRGLRILYGSGAVCIPPHLGPGFVAVRARGDGVLAPATLIVLAREPPIARAVIAPMRASRPGGDIVWLFGAEFHGAAVACTFGDQTQTPLLVMVASSVIAACEAPGAQPSGAVRVAMSMWQPPVSKAAMFANGSTSGTSNAFLDFASPLLATSATPSFALSVGGTQITVRVTGISDMAASSAMCSFGTLRVSALLLAHSDDAASITCVAPAASPDATVPLCVGWSGQSATCAASIVLLYTAPIELVAPDADPAPAIVPTTGAPRIEIRILATAPGLACRFVGAAAAGDGAPIQALVDAVSGVVSCPVPPSSSAAGGFVTLQLIGADALSMVTYVEVGTQFAYAPAARVLAVSMPRVGAGDRVIPGCLDWSAWPLALVGTHLPEADLACRFAADDQAPHAGNWISTALVLCEVNVRSWEPSLVAVATDGGMLGATTLWSSLTAGPTIAWPPLPEVTDEAQTSPTCAMLLS